VLTMRGRPPSAPHRQIGLFVVVASANSILAVDDDHVLAFGLIAAIVALLFLVYWWKRRRLRRERS